MPSAELSILHEISPHQQMKNHLSAEMAARAVAITEVVAKENMEKVEENMEKVEENMEKVEENMEKVEEKDEEKGEEKAAVITPSLAAGNRFMMS